MVATARTPKPRRPSRKPQFRVVAGAGEGVVVVLNKAAQKMVVAALSGGVVDRYFVEALFQKLAVDFAVR